MAKIKIKGKKVTGTKGKDKITWKNTDEWKKNLTVNALAGNDVINFKKSKYKNKLNGDAGNDTIYGGKGNDTIKGGAGNDKLYGYNGNDKIYANSGKNLLNGGNGADSLYGGTGSDKLYGGKGNDMLQSGSKAATTFFFSKGDGADTIKNSKKSDVIQIDSVVSVKVAKNKSNKLEITYGTDKIVVDNYNFAGTAANNIDKILVKNSKGGYDTISIYDKLNGGGGGGGDTRNYISTPANETFNLTTGNNKITFPASDDDFGMDKVTTQNTANNGYTDTLYFPNHSIENGEVTFWMVDADDPENVNWNTYKDIQADAWTNLTEYGGQVNFKGLLDNHSNLVIQDKNRSYTVKGYYGIQADPIDYTATTTNNIMFVNHSEVADDTVTIKANDKYNYSVIYSLPVEYQYNGGHDFVNSDCGMSDTYKLGQLSTATSLQVKDSGGSDTITVTNNAADISLICNVYKYNNNWSYDDSHFVLITKNDVSVGSLQAATNGTLTSTAGLNYKSSQSTITHSFNASDYNGSEAKTTAWYGAIAESVGAWLSTSTYDSVAAAIDAYNNDNTVDLSGLIAAYQNVDYSNILLT
jgi:hypothetical protein